MINPKELPKELNHWEFHSSVKFDGRKQSKLHREFSFSSFECAMDFMQESSRLFVVPQDHHPCWQNNYSTVEVWLTTHDANHCVTQKDIQLAQCLEQLWLEKFSQN